MSRIVTSKILGTRTSRRGLRVDPRPVWLHLSAGRSIGYRKNSGKRGGRWAARFKSGIFRREKKLGWADDLHDADGVDVLNFEQAVEAARRFFLEAVRESSGESPQSGPYSVESAIHDYLKSLESRGAPDHESATYDFNANVLPQLGEIAIAKLTRAKIDAWRKQLAARPRISRKKIKKDAKPVAATPMSADAKRKRQATTNRTVRRLVAALNYALETGRVNVNPMNWKITPFENAEVARAAYLTEAQQRAFVTACGHEPDFQNLVLAGLHSGCRLGELARLRVRDFIVSSKTLYIEQSKSGKPRHVFFDDDGANFFKRLAADRPVDDLLLLRANRTGWDRHAVKKPMRRVCAAAKIQRLGFHQLRHSFATRLLLQGVPMKIVAQQMGHTSVRMLEKNYGHLVDEHVQSVIAALPGVGLNSAATKTGGKVVPMRRERRTSSKAT